MTKSQEKRFSELLLIAYDNNIDREVMDKVKWYIEQGVQVTWNGCAFISINRVTIE